MNPDQPSREQIEARLTALLLGELPAAEAELLRWTISRDPELQKLHDQLKGTIDFVREAMKNPTGAPVGPETPLKLPQEQRQNLLEHFKTARPEPPQKLSWLKLIKIPSRNSLVVAAVIILMVGGLAAISIPNFVKARATTQQNACINNLRQIDAAKQEWALEKGKPADAVPTPNDLTPYLQEGAMRPVAGENYVLGKVSEPTVAEFDGKRLTASGSSETTTRAERKASTSQQTASIDNMRQITAAANEWNLETGQVSGSSNSSGFNPQGLETVGAVGGEAPPVKIALPNTESSQTASEQYDTNVFSQNVVGYVNVSPGASAVRMQPNAPTAELASPPQSPTPEVEAETTPSTRVVEVAPGGVTSFGSSSEMPKVEPPAQGGMAGSLSDKNAATVNNNIGLDNGISAGPAVTDQITNNALTLGWSGNAVNWNLQPQTNSLAENEGVLKGLTENSPFANRLQNIVNGVQSSAYATNAVAINQPQNGNFDFYLGAQRSDQSALATRENQNASTVGQTSSDLQSITPSALSAPPTHIARVGLPPRQQQIWVYHLKNANPSDVAAGLREMGLADSADRGVEQPEQSPLANRESQSATTVSDNTMGLHNGPITPASGPQAVTAGPSLNDVPIVGSLFAGSGTRTQQDALAYQREEAQIQLDQSNVEQLRQQYNIHDADVTSSGPVPTLSSEQLQALNERLTEQNALSIKLKKEFAEFKTIQATDSTALAEAFLTVQPDATLSDLVEKLRDNEQRYATESNYLSAGNPDLSSTMSLNATLKQQITDRVNGIMSGLQGQVAASEAEVAAFTNQLNAIEGEGQDESTAGRPYWLAKAKLQDEEDLHKLLGEKIEADQADAAMPKNAMVTIVNPAQPGQSQNLWQRMTGTVESRAQIEIQPDITSDAASQGMAYDPYFLGTELGSIHSDAVLGKAVDALKLDQPWLKQGYDEELSRKDAIALLRSQLDLQAEKNSKLIDIGVKSEKPDEAAKIANAVAEAYQQYRLEVHSNEMESGIEKLKQKYAEEDKQIRGLETDLAERKAALVELQGQGQHPAVVTKPFVKQADIPMIPAPQPKAPIPQPEIQTSDNAFSTFSMNVSDVSFKLAMASLQKGQMPDPASIRSEEFINAFDYHDPEPLQGEPLAFTFERAQDPFAQERDMLRFSIKAAAAGRQDGRALNIVLLLDTSGSMERADRVAIIREALKVLSSQLQPQDIVSVVTFARTARLWADGIPGNEAGATLDQVGSITPEGGTNLEEAMRLAYETALRHFIAGGINRVVLLTDGAANLGNVDPQALSQKVDSERRQGIALDCFGIGWDDYNDDLLEQLSSNGDGRYAFINSPEEAGTEFAAKLAGALQVAAEDVKVQVEFNPNRVTAWRQIGYAKHQLTKQQFRDNTVAAGAIAAREAGNALYVIETNPNGQGPIATVRVRYRVPGTQDNYEKSWLVDYTGDAPELTQSSPAMRLAVTAAEISEWMADSPYAQDVTPDDLLNYLSGVPQFYGNDDRPKQLEWMIREAKSVSGK